MTDVEALRFFSSGGNLTDQSTIRRLFRLGLITVDDITTLDSTARVLMPISITARGEVVMFEAHLREMDNDTWNRAAPGHTGSPRY